MLEKEEEKERKEWVEPELIKCDEPLDEVTMIVTIPNADVE